MPGAAKMFFSLLSGAPRFFAPRADEFSESTGKLTQNARSFLYRAKGGIASRLSAGLRLEASQFHPLKGILRVVMTFLTNVNTRFSCA